MSAVEKYRESQAKRLLEIAKEMPPPPCDNFGGCRHKAMCKTHEMACADFLAYLGKFFEKRKAVQSGESSRIPSKEFYIRVFNVCEEEVSTVNGGTRECGRRMKRQEDGTMVCATHG